MTAVSIKPVRCAIYTRVSSARDLPRNFGHAWRAVGIPAAPVDKVRMRYLHDSGALCVNVGGPLPNLIQIRLRSWPAHFFSANAASRSVL